MRIVRRSITPIILATLVLSGCDADSDGEVLRVDATGSAVALLYIDRNGDEQPTPSIDAPVGGVRFSLVRGARDTVGSVTTDPTGLGVLPAVPVGTYRVVLDPAALGDSLQVTGGTMHEVVVSAGDTAAVSVPLTFPSVTVAEARRLPAGRVVAVTGIALHGWTTYGDSTVHVADSTGAVRVVRFAPSALAAGDSVRLFARTGVRDGQPVLREPIGFVLGEGELPAPAEVTTVEAATAAAGALDARLVRVTRAKITAVRSASGGDLRLTVDDGSGVLEVLWDANARITSENPPFPGARLDATGILVPDGDGRWRLKPRQSSDVQVQIPQVTVAEARRLPVGSVAAIEGVALNGWATYGDATVHVADSTAAIRATELGFAVLAAGDRVRLVGIVTARDGQPLLVDPSLSILGASQVPMPVSMSSEAAASAAGGTSDATLVRVDSATVEQVETVGADRYLLVDDGSGPLVVVLDGDTGIGYEAYVPGAVVDVTGLLVAAPGGGSWMLKPRSAEDLVER